MNRSRVRTARPVAALREGRNDWYQIKAQADGPASVMIYDEIGYWGVSAADFVNELAGIDGDLDVHLNSPGGEIFDGIAIYEALSQRDGNVSITVDSLAASIASVIAMAASPGQLTMARSATMMIHNGWGMCVGDASDMKAAAGVLDMLCGQIAGIYADRTGKPADDWRAAMDEESWYTAEQAVAAGLADQVAAKKERPAAAASPSATWDLTVFAHTPARLLQAATGAPYRPKPYMRDDRENVQCPTCEKFGDQDASYCGQCGTKLAGREDVHEDDTTPAPAPAAQASAEPPAAAETGLFPPWTAAASTDPFTQALKGVLV